jgi:hypothetical protein
MKKARARPNNPHRVQIGRAQGSRGRRREALMASAGVAHASRPSRQTKDADLSCASLHVCGPWCSSRTNTVSFRSSMVSHQQHHESPERAVKAAGSPCTMRKTQCDLNAGSITVRQVSFILHPSSQQAPSLSNCMVPSALRALIRPHHHHRPDTTE